MIKGRLVNLRLIMQKDLDEIYAATSDLEIIYFLSF